MKTLIHLWYIRWSYIEHYIQQKAANNFIFSQSRVILQSTEDNLVKATYDFILFYEKDINSDFTTQMLSLKKRFKRFALNYENYKKSHKLYFRKLFGVFIQRRFNFLRYFYIIANRCRVGKTKNYQKPSKKPSMEVNEDYQIWVYIERSRTQELNIKIKLSMNVLMKKREKKTGSCFRFFFFNFQPRKAFVTISMYIIIFKLLCAKKEHDANKLVTKKVLYTLVVITVFGLIPGDLFLLCGEMSADDKTLFCRNGLFLVV